MSLFFVYYSITVLSILNLVDCNQGPISLQVHNEQCQYRSCKKGLLFYRGVVKFKDFKNSTLFFRFFRYLQEGTSLAKCLYIIPPTLLSCQQNN